MVGRQIEAGKVYIIGAGPGDPELITVRGQRILQEADLILYADSLVSDELLEGVKASAEIWSSASMHLEELVSHMVKAARAGKVVVRIHSGDPSVYGAMTEQMAALKREGIPCEIVPGVSAAFAAAAAAGVELTVPGVSQTVIFTRTEGRASPLPEGAQLQDLAHHPATFAIFLSAALAGKVVEEMTAAGWPKATPVLVVARASWPDEQIIRTTLEELPHSLRDAKIHRQAMIFVGKVFEPSIQDGGAPSSRLYDPSYSHLFRKGLGSQ